VALSKSQVLNRYLLDITAFIHNVRSRLCSLITKSDVDLLYSKVVEQPSSSGSDHPLSSTGYGTTQKHQSNRKKRKQTILWQWCRSPLSFGWNTARLSGHRISVNKCVPHISPNEEVTLLLAQALKDADMDECISLRNRAGNTTVVILRRVCLMKSTEEWTWLCLSSRKEGLTTVHTDKIH
jgi:hypothetical protein